MNSKYTGKLVEHLLDKISSLSSGDVGDFIGTELLDKFLRKDLDERTPHSLASDKKLEVGNFVSGTAGAVIYIDELTKHSVAEIDKLYVRLKAYFELLEIVNVNSVGGKLIISPAGGIKCSLVETYDSWGYYRCYFLSELDGEKIENRFAVGDLAYSKTFNAREGSYNKISNRYYWRLVVGRGENYIDLSKTDCDADSDEPQEGDVIVHRGNRNDVDRQNCLEFSSVDSFSPSITLYQGINDYSLADKNVIQFGVEKSTGKAFMNVYGDMFIGNRDNSSYIRYSPEKGVEIKGKLDIGTSFGDKTLLDAIDLASTAYEEDLNNLKDIVNRDILNILNLLDGAIETWFYDPTPTLTNLPASLWTTESDRNIHLGDLYYSGAGRAYRFQYDADNSLYYWQEIVDTDIVLALENAKKAQDTADSKRKIFVRKPEASDSYDIGDMWVNATYSDGNVTYTEDLLRAILSKEIGEQFNITHWTLASKYTDDTVANDALQKATEAQNSVNELLNSVGDFKDYVDNAFLDGIIDTSEAQAIEKYINLLDTIKLQVDKSYEEIIKNSILENTLYLTNLNNSYTAFSSSYTELINTINSAISDSKTTDLEKAAVDGKYKTFNDKYRDYTAYLNLAINYIEETINGKVERALLDIGGYKYLKAALLENTSIEGGLIQSSMLSLGYTKNNLFLVMAGTNGLVLDKGDRTIASWFGGGMIDMFDYYDSNTKTFNVPEDVRAAAGLDRMDGTGYRAKGNLWWDEAGVVHADPLSFFVGESTVGGLLASFLVVMKEDGKHPLYLIPQVPFLSLEIADYIRIGDALLKYDSASKAIYVTSADGTTSMGFYASGYVSALGKNSSGSSTGSASALYQLVDVLANENNDGVQGATTNSVLMYNGTKWYAGTVNTGLDEAALKAYLAANKYTTTTYVDSQISTINSQLDTKADKTALSAYLPLSGGTITGDLTVNDGTIYVGTKNYVYHTGNLAGDNAWITLSSDIISHKTIHANNITLIASSGQFVTGYTVDKAGHIVSISQRALNASDIPNIAITQVTGLQDALDKKVDSAFFARVFGLLDANGNEIAVNDVTTVADSIKAKFGLWTEQYISAKGKSSSGGGGGASALYQLVDVIPNSTNDGVLNATNGSVLMYNGSKWQAGNVVTDISPLTLNVNGSSLFTYDGKSSITANLTVPTKVSQLTNDSGYLTAITKAQVEGVLTGNITSHTHDFKSLTSKPTTIAGYGITDKVAYRETANNFIHLDNEFTFIPPAYQGYIWINLRTSSNATNGAITEYRFAKGAGISYADIRAAKYIVDDGTSSQFLKGDGSLDSTAYLPLSGGTLTGNLTIAKSVSGSVEEVIRNTSNSSNAFSILKIGNNAHEWCGVLFVNSSTRTTDGEANTFTIRNDFGILRLGNSSYASYFDSNLGVGTSTPAYKLDVNGTFNATTIYQNGVALGARAFDSTPYYPIAGGTSNPVTGEFCVATDSVGQVRLGHDKGNKFAYFYWSKTAELVGLTDTGGINALIFRTNNTLYTVYHTGNLSPVTTSNVGSYAITSVNGSGTGVVNLYLGTTALQTTSATLNLTGIGNVTASGSYQITNTAAEDRAFKIHSSLDDVYFGLNSLMAYVWVVGNHTLRLGTNSTSRIEILGGGNVGIGTTSPTQKLDVNGNISIANNGYISVGTNRFIYHGKASSAASSNLTILASGSEGGGSVQIRPYRMDDDSYSTTFLSNGNVGIGTTSPQQKLQVEGAIVLGSMTSKLFLDSAAIGFNRNVQVGGRYDSTLPGYQLHINSSEKKLWLGCEYTNGWTVCAKFDYSGNVSITNNISAGGAVTAKASSSDIRLKTDITDYKALSIIRSHKSIKYHWNAVAKANADVFNDDYWHYGLIAQDVQRDMPQLVSDVFKDYLVINYERLIPICWKGLQEVDDEVTKLKKKVRKLEMEIRELKQKEDKL